MDLMVAVLFSARKTWLEIIGMMDEYLVGGNDGVGRREFGGSNGWFTLRFIRPPTALASHSPLDWSLVSPV
jgi:hypothetical protein